MSPAKPATDPASGIFIPFCQVSKFELSINLKTAKALAHDPEKCEAVFRKSMPSGLTRLRGRSPFGAAKARGIMRKQQSKARWCFNLIRSRFRAYGTVHLACHSRQSGGVGTPGSSGRSTGTGSVAAMGQDRNGLS